LLSDADENDVRLLRIPVKIKAKAGASNEASKDLQFSR